MGRRRGKFSNRFHRRGVLGKRTRHGLSVVIHHIARNELPSSQTWSIDEKSLTSWPKNLFSADIPPCCILVNSTRLMQGSKMASFPGSRIRKKWEYINDAKGFAHF